VLIDSASFGEARARSFPELLRLQAAGVAVVVLRCGDDLAAKLGAPLVAEAARA